jgi:hypothetical protein
LEYLKYPLVEFRFKPNAVIGIINLKPGIAGIQVVLFFLPARQSQAPDVDDGMNIRFSEFDGVV